MNNKHYRRMLADTLEEISNAGEMDKAIKSPSKHIPLARLKQIKRDNAMGEGGQEYSEEELNQEISNRQVSEANRMVRDAKRHEREMARQAEDQARGKGGMMPGDFPFLKIRKSGKIPGGLAEGKKPSDFPKFRLTQGKKVEMEHTSDPKVAEEIAMDHLTEDPKYYDKLKTIEKKPLEKADTQKPALKRGDIVRIHNGVVLSKEKYVVHGQSKHGQSAHWVVPVGENDSRKGFYHRSDRIHLADNVEKSSLQKMSRPRITFPQFKDITNRPDQDVKTLENERQKQLYGRQVANADFKDRKITRPARIAGSSKVVNSKEELVDAYGKRVAGKFGRTVLGLSHNTPQGPKSAALAGKLRSKFEEGDETDKAKMDAHKQKTIEARNKYEADIRAWKEKADSMPSGSEEYYQHVKNRPKYKAPRRPSKSLKDTASLSPEKMAERGKAVDATIEHEGFHDTMARIENKYGPVASGQIVRDLIGQHNPETIEAVRGFITDTMNYKEGKGRFNEELITHARDILVNPVKRQRFKQYLQNKLGMGKDSIIAQHIKNLKQGHQKAYERAKNISLADIRPDLAQQPKKMAASEMEKGSSSSTSLYWKENEDQDLHNEYEWEYKNHWAHTDLFPTVDHFKNAVRNAKTVEVTPEMDQSIRNRSRIQSIEELKNLTSQYQFPRDVDRIVQGLKSGSALPHPIVIKRNGNMTIMSGNTRMDAAFLHGINPHVKVIDLDKGNSADKSRQLKKGAARRLYGKFNPLKELGEEGAKDTAMWISGSFGDTDGNHDPRKAIPETTPNARLRMLNKLSNRTKSRINAKTGKREFLLHRQMSEWEHDKFRNGNTISHPKTHSSWTPFLGNITESSGIYSRSNFDPEDTASYNHVVSAWIPESHIKTFLPQYGDVSESRKIGPVSERQAKEQEVVVRPSHNSEIHEVYKDTGENSKSWTWKKVFGNAPVSKPKKMAASEMEKGAARRIYGGLNPNKLPGRDEVNEWQTSVGGLQDQDSSYDEETHQAARRDIPRMEGGHRLRALNKLSNRTLTRKHPETGKTQYLLFRGVGPNERQSVLDGAFVQHEEHSSWTPHIGTAKGFEMDYHSEEGPAKTIAAWVDEDKIHAAPHMYGNMPGLQTDMDDGGKFHTPGNNLPGKNAYSTEHEIVLAPHTSDRATKGDVKRYQAIHSPSRTKISQSDPKKDLHGRINYRGEQDKSGFRSTKQYPLIRETRPLPSAVKDIISSMKKPKKMAASEEENE